MKKFLQKKLKNEKGMTLIELLAVIVIIAIIAAIAIPAISNIIDNSRVGAAKSDALNVLNAAVLYETDGNTIDSSGITVQTLVDEGYLESSGEIGTAAAIATGPVLTHTFTDLVGTGDLVLTAATIEGINSSDSSTVIREALESSAASYTIDE